MLPTLGGVTLAHLGYWFATSVAGGLFGYLLGRAYYRYRIGRLYEDRQKAALILEEMEERQREGMALMTHRGEQLPPFTIRRNEPPEENRERLREHLEIHAPEMGADLIEEMVTMLEHHIYEVTAIDALNRELDEIDPEDFGDMGR